MLNKLRHTFTALCAFTTTTIFLIAMVSTFIFSKSQLTKRSQYELDTQLNSIFYALTDSYSPSLHAITISQIWLTQMEHNNDMLICIEDNHTPLLFKGCLVSNHDRDTLIKLAKETAIAQYDFDFYTYTNSHRDGIHHISFELPRSNVGHFLVSVASTTIYNSNYQIILLKNMKNDDLQIQKQFCLYALFFVTGTIFLFLFSYYFAKHIIKPIEESDQKQKEFIASASHELRSPLAVVQTNLSALQNEYPHLSFSPFYVSTLKECKRMSRLISDLLLLSRADTHTHWSLELQPTEIDTLLLECYDTYSQTLEKEGRPFTLKLPDEVMPPYQIDVQRLTQVLTILIDNALTYTPIGSPITLTLTLEQQSFTISVIDYGPGIPDEYKPHVFDRFYRIDASRHKKEHSGLGLSIALEITTLHNGKLQLMDTVPQGCTFSITLPIKHT